MRDPVARSRISANRGTFEKADCGDGDGVKDGACGMDGELRCLLTCWSSRVDMNDGQ